MDIFYNPYIMAIIFAVALVFGVAGGVIYSKFKKKGGKAP